ncbi:hypothetical protein GOODEAATRI_009308 [Goodea atripinnis]|uniref:Uncharacterized protein n=1 Tax=Goodea atripinnis TaxID=208336 RepID=A0ABV0MGK2_9TELE
MNVAGVVHAPTIIAPPPCSTVETTVPRCLQSTQSVPAGRIPYRVKLSAGKRYAWCACGHSKKQVSERNTEFGYF